MPTVERKGVVAPEWRWDRRGRKARVLGAGLQVQNPCKGTV